MDRKKWILIIATAFIAGWLSNEALLDQAELDHRAIPIREGNEGYTFIDPLLVIDNSDEEYAELQPLKEKFEDYIDKKIENKEAESVAVYFRDLNTISWTGVNEDHPYSPGSMLKVTTLIAYLKLAGQNPDILQEKIYYHFVDEAGQYYKPTPLKDGRYTIVQLLQQMITESDNTAMHLIDGRHLDKILKIYDELQIPNPVNSPRDFMSARQYSRLFRVLYNSTYLSRPNSDQALALLTYAEFSRGLTKFLPKDIKVAHKFGEQTFLQDGALEYRELHDCGIVYIPNKPYVLCVMSKGKDFNNLENIIADLSKIAYDFQILN